VLLSEKPVGLVADDAAEPAGECGRVGQGPQAEPRGDEGLLDDVLRLVQVTQERQGVAEGHLLKAPRQLRERVQVTLPRPPDEPLQVHSGSSIHRCQWAGNAFERSRPPLDGPAALL
jgi:hypothetical protein